MEREKNAFAAEIGAHAILSAAGMENPFVYDMTLKTVDKTEIYETIKNLCEDTLPSILKKTRAGIASVVDGLVAKQIDELGVSESETPNETEPEFELSI